MTDYSLSLTLPEVRPHDAEERIEEFIEECGGVLDGGGTDLTNGERDVFAFFAEKADAERCVQMVKDFGIEVVRTNITDSDLLI